MVDPRAHGCLEGEALAAYVDHRLSLAERRRVDAHLASCRECMALLAGVVRTVAEVSALTPDAAMTAEATPPVSWRRVGGALTAAAAVIAMLAGPALVRPWLERDTGLVSLADAAGKPRSVLGRLTGGFPHAPLGVPSAGGQDGQAAETDRVLLTAGRIRESFGDLQTPSRLHALGVSELMAGRYDDAAQSLLAASREQPSNAQYLNDVAAVQLERARLGLRPDDLPRALAAADRARRLDPSLREAWFNRALAAAALSLTEQAKAAWTEYLARDSASPWAVEARSRLEELSKPTPAQVWTSIEGRLQRSIDAATADEAVRAQTTEARNFIENGFGEWARAVVGGRVGAAPRERLRVMADAMLRVAGDALYRDAVAAIDRAETAGPRALQALAQAHVRYAEGAALVTEDQYSAARPRLLEARKALAAAGSAFEWRAALDQGAAAYFGGDWGTAAPLLEQLVAKAQQSGYGFVAGRAMWQQGLAAFQQGRLDAARAHYEDTLATFERMGDVEQAGGAHNLLTGLAYQLGDTVTEWRHRRAALDALSVSRSLRFRYQTLAPAAISARTENPETALAIQQTALAIANESGRDATVVDALAQQSATLLLLGRNSEAARGIAEARRYLERLKDPAFRALLELPVLAVESDLRRSTDPAQAAAAAQRAIDIAAERGERTRLPQFQLRLAKARIAWGKLDEAEHALAAGIQVFDETRAKPAGVSGISAFDESWQLYESAVRLAIRRGDYARAFAMAERARETDVTGQAAGATVSLAEAQRRTRPNEAVIALNQFDDELAVWLIRSDKAVVLTRPVRKVDAQRLVARQQEEIRFELARSGAGGALFDAIMRPLAAHLTGVERVIFVPDATYQDASLAAMWDRSRNQFLVEQLSLSSAPSVGALAALASRAPAGPDERVLIVAASSEGETAKAIAGEYQAPVVMTGAGTTPARFFADAQSADVVHLAMPTYANAAYPLLSRLVLDDEPGRRYSGTLLGRDIASRPLPATRLVVLDEIRNAQRYQTAGTFSLARAFLAAGVPAVLGTLPGADESATRELMVGFHRELARQASAVDALTRLQRDVLGSNGRRLGAWSALVIYGSDR